MGLKQWLLDLAELIDAYRVFPRLFFIAFIYILWDVHSWYSSGSVAQYPDVYVNLVWGAIGVITGFYVKTGRDWH